MIRQAIIVGGQGEPTDQAAFAVAVQADVSAMYRFLVSDYGGAWEPHEIVVLDQPSRGDVVAVLRRASAHFTVTAFSGHGWFHQDRQEIWVNPYESMRAVEDFRTSATRQLTIIDSCQTPPATTFGGERRADTGRLGQPPDERYRRACRQAYDNWIMSVGEQRSIMWACSPGQGAGYAPDGGFFTKNLVGLAANWARTTEASRTYADVINILDVRAAFGAAEEIVRTRHYPQQPELWDGRGLRTFAFAVG
jgi:hypothetical protein